MHILIMNGERAGEQIELTPPKVTIGRELDNDISLLVVGMSRYHAELELKPPSWILRDLRSTNGIKVNGRKIKHNYSVRDGDEIEIGRIKLKYDKTPLKKEDKPTAPKIIKGKMIERTKADLQKRDQKQETSIKAENSADDTVKMKLDDIKPSTATSIGLTLKKPSNKNMPNEDTPKKEEKDNNDFETTNEKHIKIEENNEDAERLKEEEAKAKIEVAKVAKIKKEEEQAKADQLKREEAKAKIESAKAAKAKIKSKPKLSLKKDTKEVKELEEQEESPKEEFKEKETELEAQKRRLKELRKKRAEMRKSHKNLPKIEKNKDLGDVATNTRNINKKAFMKFFDK